jgi:hypothetical protein
MPVQVFVRSSKLFVRSDVGKVILITHPAGLERFQDHLEKNEHHWSKVISLRVFCAEGVRRFQKRRLDHDAVSWISIDTQSPKIGDADAPLS